ncbi:hypothetical protein ACXPWS_09145 [Mycobacterium sp. BMJ-28]
MTGQRDAARVLRAALLITYFQILRTRTIFTEQAGTDFNDAIELVAQDCLLYAHVVGNEVHVYRSLIVPADDEWLQPVRDIVGEAEPINRLTVEDENMVWFRAEHAVYRLDDSDARAAA